MQHHSAKQFLDQLRSSRPEGSLILDIDDTLIDCRHRKKRVISDFVSQLGDSHASFERSHLERLKSIEVEQVRFRISECLEALEILHPELESQLFGFWRQHYFSYSYLKTDIAFSGAIEFVKQCLRTGVHIIYLTGRDEPGMGQGTRERLLELGFPLEQERIQLILKPDPQQPDLEFKRQALQSIAKSFPPVVALFENEIRNLNMMAEYFKKSSLFWRPTLQSPNQPEPHPDIRSFPSFDVIEDS